MFLLVFVWVLITIGSVCGQSEGWRMVDRFYGFRYELLGHVVNAGIEAFAVEEARLLGCFGWIQQSNRRTLVGEARCPKTLGPVLQQKLREKSGDMKVLVSILLMHPFFYFLY